VEPPVTFPAPRKENLRNFFLAKKFGSQIQTAGNNPEFGNRKATKVPLGCQPIGKKPKVPEKKMEPANL